MRQHPIPQNILDIEFKLFTKFTVREFVYMAVGIGFGGIFLYFFTRGEIPGLIAIPIFIMSSAIGLFLGLVPINDQKSDIFLKNYIIAITNPTRRVWRSKNMTQEMNNQMIEEGILDATKGTLDRNEQDSQSQIIGSENLSKNQFIEQAVIDTLDKDELERLSQIEKDLAASVNMTVNTKDIPMPQAQPIAQPQVATSVVQLEKPQRGPIVIPRVTINQNNISRFQDTSIAPSGVISVNDTNGLPLQEAIIALKNAQGKVLLAQKTNEKGYTQIDRNLEDGVYQLAIAAPKNIFPEVVIEIHQNMPSIKISAL